MTQSKQGDSQAPALSVVPEHPQPPASIAESTLSVIERLAKDPASDVEKLDRLLQMQERVMARNAEMQFNEALADFQEQCPMIVKFAKILDHKNKVHRGNYCPYGSLMEQIQPYLTRFGFSVHFSQDTDVSGGRVKVAGYVRHRGGYKEPLAFESPPDKSGNKADIQAIGSARSYAKRYAIQDFFNLRMVDDDEVDDDGNLTGKTLSGGDESFGKFATRMRRLQDAEQDGDQTPKVDPPRSLDEAWDRIHELMEEDEIGERAFVAAMRRLYKKDDWEVTDLSEEHANQLIKDEKWKTVTSTVLLIEAEGMGGDE